jgi:hypothetical protein
VSTQATEAPGRPAGEAARPRTLRWVVLLGALVCAGLWAWSLTGVDLAQLDGFGLLSALPVAWYASLAGALGLYLAVLLGRGAPGRLPVLLHVVLVAVLHATTPVLYDAPRFPYLYKHVGVTEFLLANGGVDRSIDIYNNFPGFFYLTAGLDRVTGVPAMDLARWWQPVLALLFAAAVYWAVGSLTTSQRVRYGTTLLFTLGDWVQQSYFAPQSIAFVLGLVVVGGLLRTVPAGRDGFRWRRLVGSARPSGDADDAPRPSAFWSSGWGSALLVLAFAAIAVSHQMTPVIVLVQAVVISVVLRPARPWLVVVLVLVEVAWLAQAWTFLTANFDLFSFGGTENIAPPTVDTSQALPGQALVLWAAPVLMAVIALLAACAFLLGLRRGRAAQVLVPALVGGLPLGLILGQPYGQEAIFRLFLFGLPWACYLVASWLLADGARARVRRGVVAAVAVLLLGTLLPPSLFGSELVARQSASDVAIDTWFEENAPDGSVLLPLTPSFPLRSTADYVGHRYGGTLENPADLASRLEFRDAADDPAELVDVARNACFVGTDAAPVHIAVGPSAERFVRLYGLVTPEVYDAFVAELTASGGFELVRQEGESRLFRCPPLADLA